MVETTSVAGEDTKSADVVATNIDLSVVYVSLCSMVDEARCIIVLSTMNKE
jgi:hypothetical protein